MTVKAKVRERTVALRVQSGSTVGALKKRILADAKEGGKWLRLIHSGRMLADDDDIGHPRRHKTGALGTGSPHCPDSIAPNLP